MKANDIICVDTQKTRVELDLDISYGNIMIILNNILKMCGLENNFLDRKLDCGKITQTELDNQLISLIEIIKYGGEK